MKQRSGTLFFIKSDNPPVFTTPMDIVYTNKPTVGEAFFFGEAGRISQCNLSTIKAIRTLSGVMLIETRNSVYVLNEVEE